MKFSSQKLRSSLFALASIATASLPGLAAAAEIFSPKAVVELFTSQGCSSCPPADKVLRSFNEGQEILGLAYHVDYWDRLGWKDTFGSPEFTKRQWNYANALEEKSVYTPQAIVNGRKHVVGSRQEQITDLASGYDKSGKGLTVPVRVTQSGGKLSVEIPKNSMNTEATLYAVYYDPSATVEIGRGENTGKTISYSNIVRKVEMVGMAGANGMKTDFSIADLKAKGFDGCALILQTKARGGTPGPIIGAAVIENL